MIRRKTPKTIRLAKAAAERKRIERNEWIFIEDYSQTMFYNGAASFTAVGGIRAGDIIAFGGSGESTTFNIGVYKKPPSPKNVHPARRKKARQKKYDAENQVVTLTDGGSAMTCKKISADEWIVIGDNIS